MLAVLRESILNRCAILRTRFPTVSIAMVLFAVHKLVRLTNTAMLYFAPRLLFTFLVRVLSSQEIPPSSRMTPSKPPASMETDDACRQTFKPSREVICARGNANDAR